MKRHLKEVRSEREPCLMQNLWLEKNERKYPRV